MFAMLYVNKISFHFLSIINYVLGLQCYVLCIH